jgi:hypothetical protein
MCQFKVVSLKYSVNKKKYLHKLLFLDPPIVPPKEPQGQVLRVKLNTEKPPSERPKVIRRWKSERPPQPQRPPPRPQYNQTLSPNHYMPQRFPTMSANQGHGPRSPFSDYHHQQQPFNPNFAHQWIPPPQYAQQQYPPTPMFSSPSYFGGM